MKRIVSLGLILLALGSCQSDNAPTQPESAADQVSVSARLVASKALPVAQRFRARMAVGDAAGEWSDAKYDKGTQLNLGKVKRGTLVVLDVRGYSLAGNDTVWKWFARASDSARGSVLSIVGVVEAIESPVVAKGQLLVLPAGSWYTTDASSWSNPSRVDATGAIPALAGTFVRVRLRMAVPGTKDTLLGDTLRLTLPQKPTILPADRSLAKTDSVKVSGAGGDSLVVCEGANCSNWAPYKDAYPAKAFVLRARAWRDGLVSAIETATFTLADAPVDPVDTVVVMPSFSPKAGTVASTDKISITPAKSGDSIRYTTNGKDWNGYSAPFAAGAFTVRAVALRGKYVSDTAEAAYTVSSTKPSSPSITSSCAEFRNCDPGTTFEVKSTESGVTLWYALFPSDSMDWKKYEAKAPLASSSKVFVRAIRGTDTSAVQTQYISIVPPDTVAFSQARRTTDTVWVKLSTTSGTVWYARGTSRESVRYTDSIPVRAGDSLRAWSERGTAKSAEKTFRANSGVIVPDTVKVPSFSVNGGSIGANDSIVITPARSGDSIRYSTDGKTWNGYVRPIAAGSFELRAFALRGTLHSDTVRATFTLKAGLPTSPQISSSCSKFSDCDPGATFELTSTDTGVALWYALFPSDSTNWKKFDSSVSLPSTAKVFARATRGDDASASRSQVIAIVAPDTVAFANARRNPDTVWVRMTTTSGTIWYGRGANDSARYSDSVPVRVLDSLKAWTIRGTAKSAVKLFKAPAQKPGAPKIASPLDSVIAPKDSIALVADAVGDTLQVRSGDSWVPYAGKVAPGKGGPFTITARSRRNGLVSDSVTKTYHVDTAKLASPTISPATFAKLDPGTEITISVGAGSTLQCSTATGGWDSVSSPFRFKANKDTTIHARARTDRKVSAIQTFAITVQLPGAVTFEESERYPDSVKLAIDVAQGDTVLYSRNSETTSSKAPTPGALAITVRANDSITAWSKRGTAYGAKKGYRMVPAPPASAIVSPGDLDVRDTTHITVTPARSGDSVYVGVAAHVRWDPYEGPFTLPAGYVRVYTKATRNGVSKVDSVSFRVHARPRKPGITGCTSNCDPGSKLTFAAQNGHDVWVKLGTNSFARLEAPYQRAIASNNTTVCAYADSSGYRSSDTCVTVTITPPVAPSITSVRTVRGDDFDSAYVTVKATQSGDLLMASIGATDLDPVAVMSATFTHVYGILRTDSDSVLEVRTRRGTATSASVKYTLSRLPPPKAAFPESAYVVGKTFSFARDWSAGALSSDTVQLSKDGGASWSSNALSLALSKTTEVWARTARKGYAGATDRSRVLKVTYAIDSTLLTEISMAYKRESDIDSQKTWFDVTQTGDVHSMEVPDEVTSLVVDFKGRIGEISQFIYRCDNCTNKNDAFLTGAILTVGLENIGMNQFTFTMKATGGLTRTYRIAVRRTAPWNGAVEYGTVADGHDGVVYRTVRIGGKTWMAENLRYEGPDGSLGVCYQNDTANCREYGRLYTWAEAMQANPDCDMEDCSAIPSPHDLICPGGFRLPELADWQSLAQASGEMVIPSTLASYEAAQILRSTSAAWNGDKWTFSATDAHGFRALPAGSQDKLTGSFSGLGEETYWWTGTQYSTSMADVYGLYLNHDKHWDNYTKMSALTKTMRASIRCVEK